MKSKFLFSLLLAPGFFLGSCKHPHLEGGVTKKTFVLSDTMLKAIHIDTANIQAVQIELHFSGKVINNTRRQKDVEILVDNAEKQLDNVKEGLKAEILTAALPDKIFYGTVESVEPTIDSVSHTVQLNIRLDDITKQLKREMFTKVILHYDEGDDMVAVPENAVIADHSRNYVLVFKDKYNIQLREVETYTTSGDVTYISKGLVAGENVITDHQQLIYDALSEN
jgi:multidrug efflux pump subunit AcrA (membrane-fusion protein)